MQFHNPNIYCHFSGLYIFHYKYVASAVIYFKCGKRIPKSERNGKKRDGDDGDDGDAARYLCTVKSEKFKFK